MPLYTFELGTTLEASQMKKVAEEITEWHAQAFTIPRMAISCQFQDSNSKLTHKASCALWDETISGACISSPAERAASPKALHGVYIVSSISLAYEYGVFLPMTGTYTDWVVKNVDMIRRLAGQNIPEFQGIVLEMHVEGKYGFGKRLQ